MKKQIKLIHLLPLSLLLSFAHASETQTIQTSSESNTTHFETEHPYANSENIEKTLRIPGANALQVTIIGNVEGKFDRVLITDASGNQTQYTGEIPTGEMNKTFTVQGEAITVMFISDKSFVKEGFTVDIEEVKEKKHFETKHPYENNENIKQRLSIPGANALRVSIKGEVEANYDHVFITTANGSKIQYTGVIDENFTVSGDAIDVAFTSDSSIVKEGVDVDIQSVVDGNTSESVLSVSDANDTYEGDHAEHHVTLTGDSSSPRTLKYQNVAIHAVEGKYYYKEPIFFDDKDIKFNAKDSTITVPAGKTSFNLYIKTTAPAIAEYYGWQILTYKITLDGVDAIGRIIHPH